MEYHLDLALCSFGYINTTMHEQITIDSPPMECNRSEPDFKTFPGFKMDYPSIKEEIDPGFPLSFGPVIPSTILVDTGCAYDQVTRCSLIGQVGYVSSTPVTQTSCLTKVSFLEVNLQNAPTKTIIPQVPEFFVKYSFC